MVYIKKPLKSGLFTCFLGDYRVDATGFEPATSASRTCVCLRFSMILFSDYERKILQILFVFFVNFAQIFRK